MRLKLSRGATIQIRKFEFYRFDVGIEEDFDDMVTLDRARTLMSEWVETLFEEELKEVEKVKRKL